MRNDPSKFIEEYDEEEYKIANHLDIFCEARMLEYQKYWIDGRIRVTTDLITLDQPTDEKIWKTLLDLRNYPYEVQERIRNPFKTLRI